MRDQELELGTDISVSATWILRLFFALRGLVVVIGTWEFFRDRIPITVGDISRSPLLDSLIIATLIIVLLISIVLLLPGP